MPKFFRAHPPREDSEARKMRGLACPACPADWRERARIVPLSWDGLLRVRSA